MPCRREGGWVVGGRKGGEREHSFNADATLADDDDARKRKVR